jgi:hypothetical protein
MKTHDYKPLRFECKACGAVNEIEPFALAGFDHEHTAEIEAKAKAAGLEEGALERADLTRQLAEAQAAKRTAEANELASLSTARAARELSENAELHITRRVAAQVDIAVAGATGPLKQQIIELNLKLAAAQQTISDTQPRWAGDSPKAYLADELKRCFPTDVIEVVPPGRPGCDILHRVRERGMDCNVIAWEIKNAKWEPSWLTKAKQDQAEAGADVAMLVSAKGLPGDIDVAGFGPKDGVLVSGMEAAIPVAHILRERMVAVARARVAGIDMGRDEETLSGYILGEEFYRDVRGILEALREALEANGKLDRYVARHSRDQIKRLLRIGRNMARFDGSFRSILGPKMPPQALLDYDPTEDDDDTAG